jgi:REP element-mobilizing transposase RayT
MSRAWRIEYEGALYHLMSRGNEGGNIFFEKNDRVKFLDTVGEMSERYDFDIFAYVLMDNHYHLLVRSRQANLKRAMQWFGTTYTQRFNRRHYRSGHLFQGRYKSIIVQNDAYLLQLSYYIHRNPVRAGIVKRLADYRWSSYRVYAYGRKTPEWLSTDLILSQFEGESDRQKSYREQVQKYSREESHLIENIRHNLILGTKDFAEKLCNKYLPSKTDDAIPQQRHMSKNLNVVKIVKAAERILNCDVSRFAKAGRLSGTEKDTRDILLYYIWRTGRMTNTQIGKEFGLSYSAVSHSVKSIKAKLRSDQRLKALFNNLNSQFKL